MLEKSLEAMEQPVDNETLVAVKMRGCWTDGFNLAAKFLWSEVTDYRLAPIVLEIPVDKKFLDLFAKNRPQLKPTSANLKEFAVYLWGTVFDTTT